MMEHHNEIEEKFRTNVAFSKTVSNKNAVEALDMLNRLEEIDNINKVVQLLIDKKSSQHLG